MKTEENVVIACKLHWTVALIPEILTVFFALAAIIALVDGSGVQAFVLLLAIATVCALAAFLEMKSAYLILTENAVKGKTGLIKTKKLVSPIGKVQDVSVSSGLLGKIFGYSTVTISTAGSAITEYTFGNITNAEEFQNKIIELANQSR
jgi:membrane protein YdbS with pleckstrin-like domain